MTNTDWMNYAREHRQELLSIIMDYHPMYRSITGIPDVKDIVMGPEQARQVMRREIREKWDGGFPSIKFNEAMEKNDVNAIMELLWATWFGVPESQSFAWSLPGFEQMVFLMESPVDE